MSLKIKRPNQKDASTPLSGNLRDDFESFLATNGLEVDPNKGLIVDGSVGRAFMDVDGKRKLVGWYQLWLDQSLPYGHAGDYRLDHKKPTAVWRPQNKGNRAITDEQREEIRALKEQAAIDRQEKNNRAAKRAQNMWIKGKDIEIHPYLKKKGVENHGLKVGDGNQLMLPMWDEDLSIVGLQFIDEDGGKKFLTGSKKKGSFYILGVDQLDSATTINYAEGYATAASYFEDVNQPVVVAFDAFNLSPVAESIVKFFPQAKHVIIADCDDSMTGEREAIKAAQVIRDAGSQADVLMPQSKGDYNDHKQELIGDAIEGEVMPTLQEINVPMSFDFQKNNSGKYIASKENIRGVLTVNQIDARYNTIKKRMEIAVPHSDFIQDMQDESALIEIEDRCITMGMPHQRVRDCLKLLAKEFNPVKEWIESKPWDGKSRLQMFLDTVTSPNTELKEMLMKKWMVSCVAAAYEPEGVALEGMLVFQGAQGMGKTLWFKKLCPPNEDWLLEGVTINPADKDSVKQIVSHWIVEAGEIESTFKKADIDQLKAFITRRSDELRLPYDRAFTSYKRRTAFFASVNAREFLVDTSGNRRFWVVPVKAIDIRHRLTMQQVWAEVRETMYEEGNRTWFLTPDEREMLQASNELYRTQSSVEDLILEHVRFDSTLTDAVQMTKLLRDLGIPNPRMSDFKEAARTLSDHGLEPRRTGGKKVYDIEYTKPDGGEKGVGLLDRSWD